jgi:hypothetical protein
MQAEQNLINKMAWNTKAYQAWFRGYGTPKEVAEQMKKEPESFLKRLGEIISAIADNSFIIRKLIEEPDQENKRIPGNFTLISDKAGRREV